MKKSIFTCVAMLVSTCLFAQQQWAELTNYPAQGMPVKWMMSTGNHLFVVTPGGNTSPAPNVLQSMDGGASWIKADSNIPSFYGGLTIYFDQAHNTLIYGSGAQYGCYVATDLNNPIWTKITSFIRPCGFARVDTTLFFSDQVSGVFKTIDDCNSWTNINPPTSPVASYAIINKGDTLLTSMQFGGTFRSVNKGASWTAINAGMTNNFTNTYFVKDNYIFAGSYYHGVFRTSDNGDNWTAMNTGLPTNLAGKNFNCFAVKNDSLFVGSDSTGVFVSIDNGNNWIPFNTGIPANTTIYTLVVHNNKLFAGTNDGKVYRLDRNTSGVTNANLQNNAVHIYPNPANDAIHIHTDNWQHEQLILFNITGAICYEQKMNAPDQTIDTRGFPAGLYVLRTGNGQQEKIIIQH